ncbi:hypothetical protein [Argonema antarcticum]|uniref:hypothetical protein n=1 Tax=Argonema antarcticum TaxID=2942763 RepID=UPI002010FB47|nr:hypothetical protein [Argonema antarcticum]MCL1474452.1 hypothetical protein [Argonema antarcticum A004/B2]
MKLKWTRVVLGICIFVLCVKKGWVSVPNNISLNQIVPKVKVKPKQQTKTNKPEIVEVGSNLSQSDVWSEISIAATNPAAHQATKCNTPKDKFSYLMYIQGLGEKYCDQTVNQNSN